MKTITLAAVLLTLSAGAALAQGAAGARMDTNGDSKVSLSEFTAARVAMMMRADANRDGKLTKAELETGMGAMGKGDAAPKGAGSGMMFGMMDANKDGFLTRPEIEKMVQRRFQRIDVNGDGSLSSSEMAAMRSRGMGGRSGGAH